LAATTRIPRKASHFQRIALAGCVAEVSRRRQGLDPGRHGSHPAEYAGPGQGVEDAVLADGLPVADCFKRGLTPAEGADDAIAGDGLDATPAGDFERVA
jgi:hypothetical protein